MVFEDADIESAVNGVAFAAFVASGQTCVSGTRLIVHEGIYTQFMERFVEKVKSITRRIGDRKELFVFVISSQLTETTFLISFQP